MQEMSEVWMDEVAGGDGTVCAAAFAAGAVGALLFGPLASAGVLVLGYAVCREAE